MPDQICESCWEAGEYGNQPGDPYPTCADCGVDEWEDWHVPNDIWQYYADPVRWLCFPCFCKRTGWSVEEMTAPFDPDWCVHPGATIQECLEEHGWSVEEGARHCALLDSEMRGLLTAERELSPELARHLAHGLGSTEQFWLNLEHQFREGLARGKTWVR